MIQYEGDKTGRAAQMNSKLNIRMLKGKSKHRATKNPKIRDGHNQKCVGRGGFTKYNWKVETSYAPLNHNENQLFTLLL